MERKKKKKKKKACERRKKNIPETCGYKTNDDGVIFDRRS